MLAGGLDGAGRGAVGACSGLSAVASDTAAGFGAVGDISRRKSVRAVELSSLPDVNARWDMSPSGVAPKPPDRAVLCLGKI